MSGEFRRGDSGSGRRDGRADKSGEMVTGRKTAVWNHDFLNKKPWHPLNRQNQARIFEAEEAFVQKQKREEAARAEFEAEQQFLQTLAHLPGKDADKYRHMQGVSWMYIKPPGLGERAQKEAGAGDGETGGRGPPHHTGGTRSHKERQPGDAPQHSDAPVGEHPGPVRRRGPLQPEERGRGTARALQVRFQRRAASPPIGGASAGDECHELVVEDTDSLLVPYLMHGGADSRGSVEPSGSSGGGHKGEQESGWDDGRGGRSRHERGRTGGSGELRSARRASSAERDGSRSRTNKRARGGEDKGEGRREASHKDGRRCGGSGDLQGGRNDVSPQRDESQRHSHKAKQKSKRKSKRGRRSPADKNDPGGSKKLDEALAYLVESGVDVYEMVREGRR